MPVIARYALATLTPLLLLILGSLFALPFGLAALIWLTLLAAFLDQVLAPPAHDPDNQSPWPDHLSLVLALGHLALIPLVLTALAGPVLDFGQKLALLFATASFFGQVSHPNAHELIHRRPRWLSGFGGLVYISVLYGHHASAHRLVHHRYVGTDQDPNTPLPSEGFWDYVPRAWKGEFEAGLMAENDRLSRRGKHAWSPSNPYIYWVTGGILMLFAAVYIAGLPGLLAFLTLAALTHLQILLSDYIQHYGLQRLERPDGRLEPVAPHHSWNAPKGFSSYLMMNAPSHSEHHMHPDRPYNQLDTGARVPILPYSVPIMAMLATLPPVWHRVMDKRALRVMQAAEARLHDRSPEPETTRINPAS
ncbi:alkane 1-monooxygenase [Rhodophyticola sp. CCM32]|uniref:alkane 1-monooxygenase n=1 Tax=Rhodophyticola sp. CCM32 TaxID=2916397 RepID=UPI00107F0995|nr:alkane 1-monooxygenase [Rhodophyticola sp. CCM32]QBY00179.1 alkane 1-monooxygenase [Rhodophyticola sp. CCM32]